MAEDEGGFLDSFTSADDSLKALVAISRDIRDGVQNINPTIDAEKMVVREGTPREEDTFDLSARVEANADNQRKSFTMPYDGYIDGITVDMPDGSDQLVGVSIRHGRQGGGSVVFPKGDSNFVAFDDYGDRFDATVKADKDDEFYAVYASQKTIEVPINCLVHTKKRIPGDE